MGLGDSVFTLQGGSSGFLWVADGVRGHTAMAGAFLQGNVLGALMLNCLISKRVKLGKIHIR